MNDRKVALTLLVAPLFGSLAYVILTEARVWVLHGANISQVPAGSFVFYPEAIAYVLLFGWIYGALFVLFLGLPIGFAIAAVLKRFEKESGAIYTAVGALAGFVVIMMFPSRADFWLSGLVIGATMGAGFWRYVRQPKTALHA